MIDERTTDRIRWGILSTARIGINEVIPALQKGVLTDVMAIASRDLDRATAVAGRMGIPRAYGSYEELLADPAIDAVYIPLPNHLHMEWSKKALEAGKHVLCEKPFSTTAEDIEEMIQLRDASGLLVGEAFMVLHSPRWQRVRELIQDGSIGRLRSGFGLFSYNNLDSGNIRNIAEFGGGGLYDIGCYPVVLSRYVFGCEPSRVIATFDIDPKFGVDRLTSGILDFPQGQMVFTVSTQMVGYQVMQFFGTEKMLEVSVPYNAPDDRVSTILVNSGNILEGTRIAETFPNCNQYTAQGDAFARSIRQGIPFAGSLENALANARVLDALFASGRTGSWVEL